VSRIANEEVGYALGVAKNSVGFLVARPPKMHVNIKIQPFVSGHPVNKQTPTQNYNEKIFSGFIILPTDGFDRLTISVALLDSNTSATIREFKLDVPRDDFERVYH
jgi:hypothetical protein